MKVATAITGITASVATALIFSMSLALADSNRVNRDDVIRSAPQIEALVKSQPTATNYYFRGCLRLAQNRYEEAEADFATAAALKPPVDPFGLNDIRGANLLVLKRYDEAIDCLTQALAVKPNSANTLGNRGATYAAMKRYPEALADSMRALKLDPNVPTMYTTIGECYLRSRQYPLALQYLDGAIKRTPANFEAYQLRGETYQAMGKKEFAVRDFTTAKHLGYEPGKQYVEQR
jgi:tetratricopeptide (TPR) repeat protein